MQMTWKHLVLSLVLMGVCCAAGAYGQATPVVAKAKLSLADLTPAVAKPANKAYPRELHSSASKAMKEASVLRKSGDASGAAEKLQRALGFDPENPQVHKLLGLTCVAIPNHGRAMNHLRKAEVYLGDDVGLQLILGRLGMLQKQTNVAMLHFRRALLCSNAKPNSPQASEARMRLAMLLEILGYYQAGLECVEQLQKDIYAHSKLFSGSKILSGLVEKPELLLTWRGRLLQKAGRPKEAAVLLRRAHKRNRADPIAAKLLLTALLDAGDTAEAELLIVELSGRGGLERSLPEAVAQLCKTTRDAKQPGRIWRAIRARSKKKLPLPMTRALARAAMEAGADDDAVAILDVPGADAGDLVALRAGLITRRGKPTEALDALAAVVAAGKGPKSHANSARTVRDGVAAMCQAASAKSLETFLDEYSRSTYKDETAKKFARHYAAGILARRLGKTLKAADHFKRAIEEKKGFFPAYEELVDLQVNTAKDEDVEILLALCKQAAGEGALYNYLLGRSLLARGKLTEAVATLDKAHQADSKHLPTTVHLVKALLAKVETTKDQREISRLRVRARAMLLSALATNPRELSLYQTLFDLYFKSGDRMRMISLARSILTEMADQPEATVLAVRAYLAAGDLARATPLLEGLQARHAERTDVQLLAVTVKLSQAKGVLPHETFVAARDALIKILQAHPNSRDARELLAKLYALPIPGDYAKAAALWVEQRRLAPDDLDATRRAIGMLLLAKKYKQARAILTSQRKAHPDDAKFRLQWLRLLSRTNKSDEAVPLAEKWYRAAPKAGVGYLQFAIAELLSGKKYAQLIPLLELARNGNASSEKEFWKRQKISLLYQAGLYEKGEALLGKDPAPLDTLAATTALLESKKYGRAIGMADVAIAKTKDVQALSLLKQGKLQALCGQGKYDQAQTYLEANFKGAPRLLTARVLMVDSLTEAREYDRAIRLLDTWLAAYAKDKPEPITLVPGRTPVDPVVEFRKIVLRLFLATDQYDKALQRIATYRKDAPKDATLLHLKGTVLGEMGKTDVSIATMTEAMALDETNSGIANDLAYSLAEAGVQLEKANKLSAMAIRAKALMPFLDTRAWVLYKQAKLDEASDIFITRMLHPMLFDEPLRDDLAATGPDGNSEHPVLYDHAGDVLYQLGWHDWAKRYWQRALVYAKADKKPSREVKAVLKRLAKKIQAVEAGQPAPVAPFGKDVSIPKSRD